MMSITFITADGRKFDVKAGIGSSVMEVAVRNGVPGIEADCGGACACATCHVYVDPEWMDRAGGRPEMENEIIEIAHDVRANSRLSCQIQVTSALDGLILHVPKVSPALI